MLAYIFCFAFGINCNARVLCVFFAFYFTEFFTSAISVSQIIFEMYRNIIIINRGRSISFYINFCYKFNNETLYFIKIVNLSISKNCNWIKRNRCCHVNFISIQVLLVIIHHKQASHLEDHSKLPSQDSLLLT